MSELEVVPKVANSVAYMAVIWYILLFGEFEPEDADRVIVRKHGGQGFPLVIKRGL